MEADGIPLKIELIAENGYYFVALQQERQAVLIPVRGEGAGLALMGKLRQLLRAEGADEPQ